MITKTSFGTAVLKNIIKAMREAQKNGIAHVHNRNGHAFLAVRKFICNGCVTFQILDCQGKNAKPLIAAMATKLMVNNTLAVTTVQLLINRIGYQIAFTNNHKKG
jgi:hypothetical protein